MSPVTERQAPAGRDGPAQRAARPRPDPLGRRRARPQGRASASPRAASRASRASTACPALRGVVRLGEAFVVIPLVKRALPAAKLPFESPARARRHRRRVARRHAAAPPHQGRGGRVGGADGRPRARAVRPAHAATSPPTTASSTRRSPRTRRPTTPTRARRRRSTTAAAPTSSPRCSRPTSRARCCCAGSSSARRRWPAAPSRSPRTAAAVEVFAWCERNSGTRAAKALRRPGFEIQRLVGTREPDEQQLEVGRAALEEILRVEQPPDGR